MCHSKDSERTSCLLPLWRFDLDFADFLNKKIDKDQCGLKIYSIFEAAVNWLVLQG